RSITFFSRTRDPPLSTLFPYTTLFRSAVDSVLILACGTSYHAGLVARHWIEALAGLPCNVEIASEYRYRSSVPNPRTLVTLVSQDRKSTRLNSSHEWISYAVFCLKKKN